MAMLFGEEFHVEVILVWTLIAFALWASCWYMVLQTLVCILRSKYEADNEELAKKRKWRATKRRKMRGIVQESGPPVAEEEGVSDPFCFECADNCSALTVALCEEFAADQKYAKCCQACGSFIHSEAEWVFKLVTVVEEYEVQKAAGGLQCAVNPCFPIRTFMTKSELTIYVYKALIAVLNIVLVVYYFRRYILHPRDPSLRSDLNVRILVTLELVAVGAFLMRFAFLAARVASQYPRCRWLRVFFAIFFIYFPSMSLINGVGSIKLWDFKAVYSLIVGDNISKPFGSKWGKITLFMLEGLSWVPAALCLILLPAFALLARLQQLHVCTDLYISRWGPFEWILFLRFLLDIAVMVESPAVMEHFGSHLLGQKILVISSEIFDNVTGLRNFCAGVVVIYTSGATECHEIFKENSALWLNNGASLGDTGKRCVYAEKDSADYKTTTSPSNEIAKTQSAQETFMFPQEPACEVSPTKSAVGIDAEGHALPAAALPYLAPAGLPGSLDDRRMEAKVTALFDDLPPACAPPRESSGQIEEGPCSQKIDTDPTISREAPPRVLATKLPLIT